MIYFVGLNIEKSVYILYISGNENILAKGIFGARAVGMWTECEKTT